MYWKSFYALIVFLLVQSCREDYLGELPVKQEALSLFAELSPGAAVELVVVANPEFGQQNQKIFIPDDANLSLMGTDMSASRSEWHFVAEEEKYVMADNAFRPRERNTYEIRAYVPGLDKDTLIARTVIPQATNINKIDVTSNVRLDAANDRFNHEVEVVIELPVPSNQPAYFQLIPRRAIASFRTDQNGQIHISDSGEYEEMDVVAIKSARNAIVEWTHKEGVYIDYSRLNGEKIELVLTSRSPMSKNTEAFERIQFELRTLSPDLYEYHRHLHRRIVSHQTAFSYPVTTYTNVQNGKGVFGSYNMSFSSVKFK